MGKIVKLTESQLAKIIKQVIKEQSEPNDMSYEEQKNKYGQQDNWAIKRYDLDSQVEEMTSVVDKVNSMLPEKTTLYYDLNRTKKAFDVNLIDTYYTWNTWGSQYQMVNIRGQYDFVNQKNQKEKQIPIHMDFNCYKPDFGFVVRGLAEYLSGTRKELKRISDNQVIFFSEDLKDFLVKNYCEVIPSPIIDPVKDPRTKTTPKSQIKK